MARYLTWRQVNAWRLTQHGLSARLPKADFVQAVARTGGIQAQVMSAAEQAIWARVDGLTHQDVQAALWQKRTLVKTWAMRATLHLVPASELPLYVAARSLDEPRNWTGYFEYYGLAKHQLEAYLEAAAEILSDQPMTREQFAAAVTEQTGVPELLDLIVSKGWGTPLKPLAWSGQLAFGPGQGQKVTFVNPRRWLGGWQEVEPEAALQEIARRYMRAYGPATVDEFADWWGMRLRPARKLFKSLQGELEPVEIDGWHALALQETLEPMQSMDLPGVVNLLPLFDAYVMGIGRGADIETLLPRTYQSLVYRPQGWISAVVLVDGYLQGTWEMVSKPSQTNITVNMFTSATPAVRSGIEAEAERLGVFLNKKVTIQGIGGA